MRAGAWEGAIGPCSSRLCLRGAPASVSGGVSSLSSRHRASGHQSHRFKAAPAKLSVSKLSGRGVLGGESGHKESGEGSLGLTARQGRDGQWTWDWPSWDQGRTAWE